MKIIILWLKRIGWMILGAVLGAIGMLSWFLYEFGFGF